MANVGQEELGDPHGVEGILAPPEEDENPEVTLVGAGHPGMTMKMRMPP